LVISHWSFAGVDRQRLIGANAVFALPGAAPGTAAEGQEHFQFLEHPGEALALSGAGANRTIFFAEFGAENGHEWTLLGDAEGIFAPGGCKSQAL
jgi:hypothetical protein